ncbi:FAD-binding-3 domain-containing protein [Fusarium falciforme]|uniref:FAD-binding-3 domain-containing protein n=1 Tax=Fusarium falciforme TaxID=195108 RepID=UPI002300C093|nr:FAD-binding-3 domain-containing protein [Fusarium falciforme]KAJ4191160.1 hypothetical protein NW767_010955 [Fusarium falciforme]WAO93635.1 FAD-binding-3 domain-containing protein [Fusarium falciforme]
MGNETPSHHFLEGKTIIVAGGGISGSAFVVGLRRLWNPAWNPPKILIYDRDSPEITAQREGYSLSLTGYNTSGGLLALRKLGLLDRIIDKAVSGLDGAGAFKIWAPDWKEYITLRHEPIEGLPSSSIRVPRKDVRQAIHEGLGPSDAVEWNTRCVSAHRLDNGRVRVQVARKTQSQDIVTDEDCDLLIAADGASSKIRAFLRPDDNLNFAGAILRGGISRFEHDPPAPVDKDWGFMLSGTGISCFFSPVDKNSIFWGIGHLEATPVPVLDLENSEQVQAVIDRGLELGAALQEPFRTIVAHTDPKTVLSHNARDKPAFSHGNMNELPVVFIGDSNHAVSPFAGFGANLALCDSWDLAEQLSNGHSLKEAISAYDKLAVPRAMKILKDSRARLRSGHSSGLRYWILWLMLMVGNFVRWVVGRK